jgi:hypothetical protein
MTHGMVLPYGYEVVPSTLFDDPNRQSIGFIVTGPDIARVQPGMELPALYVEDIGTHLRVIPMEQT